MKNALWFEEAKESDLGLWWIAQDIQEKLGADASLDDVMRETLKNLRPILNSGMIRAVDLLPQGEYRHWEGSVDEQLSRIESKWRELGRLPNIGEIVWFIGKRDKE